MNSVTAKDILDEIGTRLSIHENRTEETLSKTMGALNGVDMVTYNKGYCDALRQLYTFFETRVTE